MLKHCTGSTSDLRARPVQNSAVKNEGCKLDMSSSGMAAAKRNFEDLKTSLRNVEQMETVFDTPKKGRSTPYVSSPVSRGRSLSLEPALAVAGASSPPSPSLAHRSLVVVYDNNKGSHHFKKVQFFLTLFKRGGRGGVNPCSKIMSEIVVCSGGHLTT